MPSGNRKTRPNPVLKTATNKTTNDCLSATSGLLSQQLKDLLFDPLLVVRFVLSRLLLEHQTAQVRYLIDELEQLRDVVGNRRRRWITLFQMLFKYLAYTYTGKVEQS